MRKKEDREHRTTPSFTESTGGKRLWKKQYNEVVCMHSQYWQVMPFLIAPEGEGCIRQWTSSAISTQGPFSSAHAHTDSTCRQGSFDSQEGRPHITCIYACWHLCTSWWKAGVRRWLCTWAGLSLCRASMMISWSTKGLSTPLAAPTQN